MRLINFRIWYFVYILSCLCISSTSRHLRRDPGQTGPKRKGSPSVHYCRRIVHRSADHRNTYDRVLASNTGLHERWGLRGEGMSGRQLAGEFLLQSNCSDISFKYLSREGNIYSLFIIPIVQTKPPTNSSKSLKFLLSVTNKSLLCSLWSSKYGSRAWNCRLGILAIARISHPIDIVVAIKCRRYSSLTLSPQHDTYQTETRHLTTILHGSWANACRWENHVCGLFRFQIMLVHSPQQLTKPSLLIG